MAHLPTTSRARDEIRLLHGKLTELQAAAATVTPEEWDIMLRALLRANHNGSAPPLRNTQPPPCGQRPTSPAAIGEAAHYLETPPRHFLDTS